MILDKALILKGLGGLTVLGGSAAAAYFVFSNNDSSKELLEKAGLKCTFNGDSCVITSLESGKKINVKNNTTKEEGKTFTISNPSTAKIKVQKNVATSEGYNKNLKLTIEGGDINLTTTGAASGSDSITKLEQFETYEIVKEGDKYYLSWKKTAIDEKSKALGLPENDSDCELPTTNNSPTTCSLNAEKLKKIKFDGKQENPTITVNGTITLTITKVESSDSIFGKGGYKFAFNSTEDLSIPKSTSGESISIKKGTNTEFRIKETTPSGSTAKTLSLEKAWTVTTLAEKVGLTCPASGNNKECTLPTTEAKLRLYNSESEKIENGKVTDNTKKLTFAEDAADHNQGFKLTTSTEISLSEPSGKKIEASTGTGNPSYEIKEIGGKWYLAKKTTANAS